MIVDQCHFGKDLYRAKSREEDIKIINELTKEEFFGSLKAYSDGHLQISTNKNFRMFSRLQKEGNEITDTKIIEKIFNDSAFSEFLEINILSFIYDKKTNL